MAEMYQTHLASPTEPRPLLLVDDDAFGADLAGQLAAGGGFTVARAATMTEAEARLGAPGARYDALLLSTRLPDGDGRELCARLRERGLRQPIMMLSAQDDEAAMLHGLASGANDWICKPYRPAEMLARLRAQMRVFDDSVHAVFTVGPYEFRVGPRLLVAADGRRRAWLTEKEARLLKLLCRADGALVPRQALLAEVWGADARVDTHALETHVYRLRRKLEPDPTRPRFLQCSNGCYRVAEAHVGT